MKTALFCCLALTLLSLSATETIILRHRALPGGSIPPAAARQEKADGARPVLERQLDSVAPYDVVFLGYPNWCGTMPMAVWTFLESHDFGGKLIMPFCTHEGSGWGTSLQDLHDLCPTATIGQGLTLFGTTILDAEDDVRRWLQQ